MYKNPKINNYGFVALMSVIIISAILLLIASTLSLSGFYSRYNILDSELKERSSALAEACIDQGLLLIANNTSHPATTTIKIGGGQCDLGPIVTGSSPVILMAQATSSNYFTTLRVLVSPASISIISWEELP
jgi:hypothetical protein